MAVANEVKLFGKWTFEDVEVGGFRKALGAQCRHARVINALQRAAWGQRQPRVPSDCGACECVLHMMQEAKAALQMACRLECQNVCSH